MALRALSPALAALLACAAPAALADSYADTFDSGVISPHYWTVETSDGSTLSAVNGRLEMVQGSGPIVASGVHVIFNFPIVGDFTADIDYELLNWPANNYERVGISTGAPYTTPIAAVARVSDPNYPYATSEFYGSFHHGSGFPYVQSFVATQDMSGRLRMERVGATISNYYWWSNSWVLLGSYTNAATQTGPIEHLTFGIWDFTSDTAGVKVAMDNFMLDAPGSSIPAIPEPQEWALLAAGFVILALKFRR